MKRYERFSKERMMDWIDENLTCKVCPLKDKNCSAMGDPDDGCFRTLRWWLNQEEPFEELPMADATKDITSKAIDNLQEFFVNALAKELAREMLAKDKE